MIEIIFSENVGKVNLSSYICTLKKNKAGLPGFFERLRK